MISRKEILAEQFGFEYVDPESFRNGEDFEGQYTNASLAVELTEACVARQLADYTTSETFHRPLIVPDTLPVTASFWELQRFLYEQGAFTQNVSDIGIHMNQDMVGLNGHRYKDEIVLPNRTTDEELQEVMKACEGKPTAMVYGSASMYVPEARAVGESLGQAGFVTIVGGDGIHPQNAMKQVLEGVMQFPQAKTGIISTRFLMRKQGANPNVDFTIVTDNFRHRKETIYNFGSTFITLPGGMGTVDEVVTTIKHNLESLHEGKDPKDIFIVNSQGYWNGLLNWLEVLGLREMVTEISEYNPPASQF